VYKEAPRGYFIQSKLIEIGFCINRKFCGHQFRELRMFSFPTQLFTCTVSLERKEYCIKHDVLRFTKRPVIMLY